MLELSRKPDESLILFTSDGVIKIHVSAIDGQQANIDLDIPRSVTLLRDEVLDRQIKACTEKNVYSISV